MAGFRAVLRFIARNTKRIVITVVGVVVLLVGVAGLALPVLPGWALIFVGLGILATEYVWARRALEAAKARARTVSRQVLRRKPVSPGNPPARPTAPAAEDPSA